ncbi:MAG: hypothetical protein ACREJ6_13480, partial [Candidatus Methylomirabilis sp.]
MGVQSLQIRNAGSFPNPRVVMAVLLVVWPPHVAAQTRAPARTSAPKATVLVGVGNAMGWVG